MPLIWADFDLYCPRCERRLSTVDTVRPYGDLSFEDSEDLAFRRDAAEIAIDKDSDFDAFCKTCQTPVTFSDNFCLGCGQLYCPFCGHPTFDDLEECPSCKQSLFFDCPLCGFTLTASTNFCPNCYALLPTRCPLCRVSVAPGLASCIQCHSVFEIRQRESVRIVRTVQISGEAFRIVACARCGHNFIPIVGEYSSCRLKVCGHCHIILAEEEIVCPR